MNAKYFFNNLLNGKYRDYESNIIESSIKIHHQNSKIDEIYYNIHMDGSVLKTYKDKHFRMNIQQLEGNDFERYSTLQLIKAGYLMVEDTHETLIKICDYFNANRGGKYNITEDYSGEFRKGSAEIWIGTVRLNLLTVPALVKENYRRKRADKIALPFVKKAENESAIYFYSVDHVENDFQRKRGKVEGATRQLINDIMKKELNLKCEYVGCRIQRTIYY